MEWEQPLARKYSVLYSKILKTWKNSQNYYLTALLLPTSFHKTLLQNLQQNSMSFITITSSFICPVSVQLLTFMYGPKKYQCLHQFALTSRKKNGLCIFYLLIHHSPNCFIIFPQWPHIHVEKKDDRMKPCGIPHEREPTRQLSNCPISSSEISLRGKNGTTQVQSHQPQPRSTGESAKLKGLCFS